AFAYEAARAVQTAVQMGIFDRLTGRGLTARAVARKTRSEALSTAILLDALAGLGLLRKRADCYTNAPDAARHLVSRSPDSLCDLILHAAYRYAEWDRLPEAVRTGKPVRPHDMFQHKAEETRAFIRGMHNLAIARGDARRLPRLVNLSSARSLVDIGGGPATYAIHLCKAYPKLTVTVLDHPGSLEVAREYVARARLQRRITLRNADILEDAFGGPYDCALLSNIVHGESAATNRRLLKKIHRSLAPGATLIVKDHLMDRSLTRPPGGAVFALTMLMYTQGRCYGLHEIRAWLAEAGFSRGVKRRVPGTSSVAILACRRLSAQGGPGKRR
ncbi:MAG: methyltransferase, partial [Myxococcota bacterium]